MDLRQDKIYSLQSGLVYGNRKFLYFFLTSLRSIVEILSDKKVWNLSCFGNGRTEYMSYLSFEGYEIRISYLPTGNAEDFNRSSYLETDLYFMLFGSEHVVLPNLGYA